MIFAGPSTLADHQPILGAAIARVSTTFRLVWPAGLSLAGPDHAPRLRIVSCGQHVIAEADGLIQEVGVGGQGVHRAHLAGEHGGVPIGEVVSLVGTGGRGRTRFDLEADHRQLRGGGRPEPRGSGPAYERGRRSGRLRRGLSRRVHVGRAARAIGHCPAVERRLYGGRVRRRRTTSTPRRGGTAGAGGRFTGDRVTPATGDGEEGQQNDDADWDGSHAYPRGWRQRPSVVQAGGGFSRVRTLTRRQGMVAAAGNGPSRGR